MYQPPRVSLSASSALNSCVPSGKCPQKMIMNDQTLRTTFAVRLPLSTNGAPGPASSGNAR